MAQGLKAWSLTAADNGASDANINWAEGQLAPTVNNSARAMMAALAAFYDQLGGGGVTFGGSGNAYTATNPSQGTWSAYASGDLIMLRPNATNTGAATINVDALGAKSIKTADGGDVASGDLVSGGCYLLAYDGTNFQVINTIGGGSYQPLDATLTAFSLLSWSSGNQIPYFTAADTLSLATATAAGLALLDDADASAQRTTLGLGTAATQNTGTSGATIPLLNASNTLSAAQTISLNSGSLPAPLTGTILHLAGADGASSRVMFDVFSTAAAAPNLSLRRARGTAAAPSAVQNNDLLGQASFFGYAATGYSSIRATIAAYAAENWTDTAQGTFLLFSATPIGSTSASSSLYFYQGTLYPGSDGTQSLGVVGGRWSDVRTVLLNGAVPVTAGKQCIPIPAAAMTPRTTSGAASSTTESTTNKIMLAALDFDASTAEYAQFTFPAMPKSWNESTITARFVWTATNTGNVVWAIRGVAISDDDPLDAAFGTAVTVTDSVTAANDVMRSAETGAITLAGSPAEGDMVVIEVYRDAANGSDTCAVDARLIGIEIYITTNASDDA